MTEPVEPRHIVGIGASAGGVEAFRGFFENIVADTGMAFVVVLHLPTNSHSMLPEILARCTTMRVIEVTDGCRVEPNCIYVPPAGVGIRLRDHHIHLHPRAADEPRQLAPISMFFDSLATELHEDAIGIVLSGTGNDGSLGLRAIKASGGLTMAQGSDGTRPSHEGMPASAIATGAVDIIAPVEAMPAHIMALQAMRPCRQPIDEMAAEATNAGRLRVCAALQRQTGHDFSGYKEKTFLRRVQRRMDVLGMDTLDAYAERLENDRNEVAMLFQDLLIGVTAFFRDAHTFDRLGKEIIPGLFKGKGPDETLRVWVPGCATGEEAYSLAILLSEQAEKLDGAAPRVQIFATDIDEPAIAAARAGRYPSALLRGLTQERLRRHFVPGNDGSFTVGKDLRALCTFSAHSLTRDPPFSRMDMISCRNLLIYLDTELQAAVIPAFHYSLVRDGILLLGSSETVSRHEALFKPVDKAHRIFRRNDGPSPPLAIAGRLLATSLHAGVSSPASTGMRSPAKASMRASARVLERFGPAFVVVTPAGEIVQYSSRIGRFLEPAAGYPSQNVLDMARHGLRIHLRTALKQAVDTGRMVEKPELALSIPGSGRQVLTLSVEPVREPGEDTLYLVIFNENRADAINPAVNGAQAGESQPIFAPDPHMESELRETREQLQMITEEHDIALEELRSTNEELHSVNEELQSTNEELETSKEEIQSINEELQTANAQLADKVDELGHRNSDLQNLFEGTQVATIFLDPYLIIRGFTPAVANIYKLIPSDKGRPLTDIVGRLRDIDIKADVAHVLATLEPLERRVERDDDAAHYLMRILPYRTPDSRVDGTIVTFVDVTSIVQAENHQRLLVNELNHRVKNMLSVVISLAKQTIRRSASMEEFAEIYLGRVYALAAAYSLLSNESWQTVSLRDVIMEELEPYRGQDSRNVVLDGPLVPLTPRPALSLGMAVHELATNAVKYGALSVPEGRVCVTWRVEDTPEGNRLTLQWVEQNGPTVVEPAHRGFGSTLIERGLKQDMGAEVTIDFAPEGVTATLVAPLTPQISDPASRYPAPQ